MYPKNKDTFIDDTHDIQLDTIDTNPTNKDGKARTYGSTSVVDETDIADEPV